LLAGFIVATFIDLEHFIIPDEITIGGIVVGFICSLIVPQLHQASSMSQSLLNSFTGIAVGGGVVYLILRGGKLLFGRQKIELPADSKILFTETCLKLPDHDVPYEELFYRNSDAIILEGRRVEMIDRCFLETSLRLTPKTLLIGDSEFNTEEVPYLEATTNAIILPREAMGFGDVKFMAAIGAFLGWPAVIFALLVSAIIGAFVGVTLILAKRSEWSSRLPYGPYIALAATIWIFSSVNVQEWWTLQLKMLGQFVMIPFG
jgi:leader peptidase (prepilin peptidase)/N-methyltransferase